MVDIHPASWAAIGLAVAGVGLLVLLLLEKKKNRRLAGQLSEQTTRIEETRQEFITLQDKHEQIMGFQNSLKTAELTTMLQQPRLEAQYIASGHKLSWKYRIIRVLAEKGLTIDEIAEALGVSTHEARQLVTLARLAKENSSTVSSP